MLPKTFAVALIAAALGGCATLMPPMRVAIQHDDAKRVASLLDAGADLNGRMGLGNMTPLMFAALNGRYEVAKLLLERGADVNVRQGGTSALSEACLAGDARMARLLLDKGAEVTRRELEWTQGTDKDAIAALLKEGRAAQEKAAAQTKASAEPALANTPGATASDVDEPAYKLGERPDDFALIVGIDVYMDAPPAAYAERDAAAVRRHLISLGWPARNIVLLSGKDAGRAGLERYLERWLPNNVTGNSRFVFFFAGGGAADAAGKAYLLPWDGDARQLEATSYPLSRLYQKIDALKARSALVIIDAGLPETADLSVKDLGTCAALVASRTSEPAQRHGAATYALLKGLGGEALDRNGFVMLRGLYAYMKGRLAAAPRLLTGGLGEADLRLR